MPSDGVVNINFGKNFNAQSAEKVFRLVSSVGSSSNAGTLNVDFGENFNCHNLKEINTMFNDIHVDNLSIDFKDGFTISKVTKLTSMFTSVNGDDLIKINFGNVDFNIDTVTEASFVFSNFANESNSVTFDNLTGFSFPNATSINRVFSNFGTNSTFSDDFVLDLSGFVINTSNFNYDDVYDPEDPGWIQTSGLHIMQNVNPNMKIKVHNNTLGSSGRTIKQFILNDNDNLSDSNFITS